MKTFILKANVHSRQISEFYPRRNSIQLFHNSDEYLNTSSNQTVDHECSIVLQMIRSLRMGFTRRHLTPWHMADHARSIYCELLHKSWWTMKSVNINNYYKYFGQKLKVGWITEGWAANLVLLIRNVKTHFWANRWNSNWSNALTGDF